MRSVFALNNELLSSLNAEGHVNPSQAKLLTSWKPDVPRGPVAVHNAVHELCSPYPGLATRTQTVHFDPCYHFPELWRCF